MKYVDFVMEYKGIGNCNCKCGVLIARKETLPIVIISELPDNPGTSVTNWFENLATEIYHRHLKEYDPDSILWIEHYTPEYYQQVKVWATYKEKQNGVFDIVNMEWNTILKRYLNPFWRRISKEFVDNILLGKNIKEYKLNVIQSG